MKTAIAKKRERRKGRDKWIKCGKILLNVGHRWIRIHLKFFKRKNAW